MTENTRKMADFPADELPYEKCVKKGAFLRFVYYLSTTREMGYKNWVVKTFNNRYNKRNRQYLKYAYIK